MRGYLQELAKNRDEKLGTKQIYEKVKLQRKLEPKKLISRKINLQSLPTLTAKMAPPYHKLEIM